MGELVMATTEVLWISASPKYPGDCPSHPAAWNLDLRTPEECLTCLGAGDYAAVVLELPLDGWDGHELLQEVHAIASGIPVLLRSDDISASEAVRFAHLGAYQVLSSRAQASEV